MRGTGEFALSKTFKEGESYREIYVLDWRPTDSMNPDSLNRLAILVEGNRFSLFINDIQVGQADGSETSASEVGVTIGAMHSNRPVILEYDNLVISAVNP